MPLASSHRRVSCAIVPPASSTSICRFASYSIPRTAALKLLTFFISQRVPNSVLPFFRTDTFTSQRIEPSCILQSEMFRYCKMDLMVSRYAFASALLRISGSETISISGTPQRFRSTREPENEASCSSFPASSSMWILVTPIRFSSPSTIISKYPFSQSGTSACEIWYAFGRSG